MRCSARTGSKPTKPICEAPIKAMALLLHILGERGTGCAAPRLPRLEHNWVSPTPKKEAGGGGESTPPSGDQAQTRCCRGLSP